MKKVDSGNERNIYNDPVVKKVYETIRKYNMIEKNDHVIVGISGGADSVCLLHVLFLLKSKLEMTLSGVHVHHGLRGVEADNDEAYVLRLCRQLGIPCISKKYNVKQVAKDRKISEEEAGRQIRYDTFEKELITYSSGKVAVAHHMNDQAETILLNLLRGTGLRGLGGIRHVRDYIIRPLLDISREEILAYCRENKLVFMDDQTNAKTIYKRNQIRLELIPHLQEAYNPRIVEQLCKMASQLRDDHNIIDNEIERIYHQICLKEEEQQIVFSIDDLRKIDAPIRYRLYRKAMLKLKSCLKNIENKHMLIMDNIYDKQTGKSIQIPGGLEVINTYEGFCIRYIKKKSIPFAYPMNAVSGEVYIKELDCTVSYQIIDCKKNMFNYEKKYTKWFDYARIGKGLIVRNRLQGDFIYLKGMDGKKKLKDYFIDKKIDRHKRDAIPLIADGSNVLWIIGHRISDYYKVTEKTEKILEVKVNKEFNDEV